MWEIGNYLHKQISTHNNAISGRPLNKAGERVVYIFWLDLLGTIGIGIAFQCCNITLRKMQRM